MGRFKSLLFSQKRMLWTIPGLYAYFQDFPLLFIISVVLIGSLSIVLSKKHNEEIEKEECFHFHLTCNIILQCYFIPKRLPVWQRCFNIRPVPNHSDSTNRLTKVCSLFYFRNVSASNYYFVVIKV